MIKKIITIFAITTLVTFNVNAASDGELLMKKNQPSEIKDCFEGLNRATFKVNKENFTGNSYDFLLANYYDKEAGYRNRVLGNIESSKFQYLQDLKSIDLRYDSQSTYVSPVDRRMNALSSTLNFGSTYYDYKAKQNRYQTNNDKYD